MVLPTFSRRSFLALAGLPALPRLYTSEAESIAADIRQQIYRQINLDRRDTGVPLLAYSEELSRPADSHCREMLEHQFVSHWNRAGWKPYVRYSQAGITDHTAENIGSVHTSELRLDRETLENAALERHLSLINEKPPMDLHRRSILDARHTHVGVGLAFDRRGLKLIELMGRRYLEMDRLPAKARLSEQPALRGRVLEPFRYRLQVVVIFYEPPPLPLRENDPRLSSPYGFPEEESVLYPKLEPLYVEGRKYDRFYADGTQGLIVLEPDGVFSCPLEFFRKQPGIYTAAVWVEPLDESGPAFQAAEASILVS